MARIFLAAGIAGPVVFVLAIIVFGAMRPGYSHVEQFISELGEQGGDTAPLMNYLGFIPTGILVFLAGIGMGGRFPKTILSLVGTVLVAIFGAGVFAAGIYSCDPGCIADTPSREGQLHFIVSMIAFAAMISAVAIWGIQFLRMPGWRGVAAYSFVTAVVATALFVTMMSVAAIIPQVGVVQRLFLGSLLLWLIVVSARGLRDRVEAPSRTGPGFG